MDAEGNVANRNSKNQPDFSNINSYAVNGAVHYSNAVLHYTSYTDVIAIGVTGYKEANGKLKHLIGVYYVSKSNFGVGQKVDEYTDLSFLKKEHFSAFNNVISIPSNSDVYRAYYQTRDFTVLSDAYTIRWKSAENEISPNHYQFMVMCINKVTDLPIYSYKNKLGGWNVVKGKFIRLPEKNGKIDFEFMETFISAIKKLVIKDVVLYSDQKISATKAVVSHNSAE